MVDNRSSPRSDARRTSVSAAGERSMPRAKRAKYTSAACGECKRRKLKCIQEAEAVSCARCTQSEIRCSFDQGVLAANPVENDSRINQLEMELAALRGQVTELANKFDSVDSPHSHTRATKSLSATGESVPTSSGAKEYKEPLFIGTTRPLFGLNVAKNTLSSLESRADRPILDSHSPPREIHRNDPSGVPSDTQDGDPLLQMPFSTISRLLDVFQEEVESAYPILNTSKLRSRSAHMVKQFAAEHGEAFDGRLAQKDIHLLKAVLATALVLENHGKNEISSRLIVSFEDEALRITSPSDVDLTEIQVMTIMSIYHFHCDQELLAYRTIGIAGRMVLELGLHRRRSLDENFSDPESRSLAIIVFWCVYILDRRWSFGTGLSFVLVDRDIDPRIPEPPGNHLYFRCLVEYGKICSRVWEVMPQYGSPSDAIPRDSVSALDDEIQRWIASIPSELKLTHPRSTEASLQLYQGRLLQNTRNFLYLRGNYIRSLIHRHHVLSAAAISDDPAKARFVVNIAQDSIQVLIHTNNSSDVYARHQAAYNYFLVSSVAILLLAVCHAPAQFARDCREDFFAAIDLVRGFSRQSHQGRRLWNTLRGLVIRMKQLGLDVEERTTDLRHQKLRSPRQDSGPRSATSHLSPNTHTEQDNSHIVEASGFTFDWNMQDPNMYASVATPDMSRMGTDLLNLFDHLGRGYMDPVTIDATDSHPLSNDDADEISAYFMGLI